MQDEQSQELAALELLWGLREPSSFGPRRALTVQQLAEVCVRLADTEGLNAVAMQRVAQELNYTKMSLYRYVRNKAELIAVMTDLAIGAPPDLGPPEDGWRTRIDRWIRGIRATWQQHPWLPYVSEWQGHAGAIRPVAGDRPMGPNEVGWVEAAVAAFEDTPLTARERMDCVFLLSAHLRSTHAMTTAGVLPWTLDVPQDPLLDRLRDSFGSSYPALTALAASAAEPDHDAFTFGLERVLDGIELLITRR
ncbi:TetR/AcrR family transcriptional regulator [Microlunatus parietis]|uniref:AcrR family transcriptional regulator n=1 Tax=Microlunatus parietis TaxID=682979 RepID=A0A7Y9IEH0_9ACTN|nr:TetR/AcrR family transcriptional regulator [Microlunatus parietis]NYE75339.1 AcrR family transcriptional regulator [Microlunatus parietis]